MESGVVPILDLGWLDSMYRESALKNAKWFWELSQETNWDVKMRKRFESASWLHLLYWAEREK